MNVSVYSQPSSMSSGKRVLSARLEPFDSYWQAPADVERGYSSFLAYYRANYMPHLPEERAARILVISCGPGYLVNMLMQAGYTNVHGIDSDSEKVAHATCRNLACERRRHSRSWSAARAATTSSCRSRSSTTSRSPRRSSSSSSAILR
jgi:hypothetical protein